MTQTGASAVGGRTERLAAGATSQTAGGLAQGAMTQTGASAVGGRTERLAAGATSQTAGGLAQGAMTQTGASAGGGADSEGGPSNEPNCGVGHGRFGAGAIGSSEERRCLTYCVNVT